MYVSEATPRNLRVDVVSGPVDRRSSPLHTIAPFQEATPRTRITSGSGAQGPGVDSICKVLTVRELSGINGSEHELTDMSL